MMYNLSIQQYASKNYSKSKLVQNLLNHPVHIIGDDGQLSPSALIPFCSFGGNMSAMGVKINKFDTPVCNSFEANILNDQLCYEVDPNNFKTNITSDQFKQGIEFYVDSNFDRQTNYDDKSDFMIYLDTLGNDLM